jgi:hypothetical protein
MTASVMRAKADLDYLQAGFNSASVIHPMTKNLHATIVEDEG